MASDKPVVNAWTEWGTLEEVAVGRADNAIYNLPEPNYTISFGDEFLKKWMPYPCGPRHPDTIKRCNAELENMAEVLRSECVKVQSKKEFSNTVKREVDKMVTTPVKEGEDARTANGTKVLKKVGAKVHRPAIDTYDHHIKTPYYECNGLTAPVNCRDVIITIGNTIYETPMMHHRRQFEYIPYRPILNDLFERCNKWNWRWTPRYVGKTEDMYHEDYMNWTSEQQIAWNRKCLQWSLKENEILWDAAVASRCGKDVFMCRSRACNHKAMEWLRRELQPKQRVHGLHFPEDDLGSHIDVILTPLRPPRGLEGTEGLVMYNPVWPPNKLEMQLWKDNNWKLVEGPWPATDYTPVFLKETRWLNLNILSISEKTMLIEECEKPMFHWLEDMGFDPITVPMQNVYEYEGGIHCTTWDIRRDDACVDYFPDQTNAVELQKLPATPQRVETIQPPAPCDFY